MASNDEKVIEVKLVADTSDIDKSFKDVSKSADKMAKNVAKEGDKIENSLDDVAQSAKDIQSAFKNVNMKSLINNMANIQKQAMNFANAIGKMLQEAFNIQSNIDIKTTSNVESEAQVISDGINSAVSSGMAGAMMEKNLSQIGDSVGETFDTMSDKFEDMGDNITETMSDAGESMKQTFDGVGNDIKGTMTSVRDSIQTLFDNINLGENLKVQLQDAMDTLETGVERIVDKAKLAKQFTGTELGNILGKVDTSHLTDAFTYVDKEIEKTEAQLKLFQEKVKTAIDANDTTSVALYGQGVNRLQKELEELNQAKVVLNLEQPLAELDKLYASFERTPTKQNAQVIIETFKAIQAQLESVGLDTSGSGIDALFEEWDFVAQKGHKVTNTLKSGISSLRSELQKLTSVTKQRINGTIQMAQAELQASNSQKVSQNTMNQQVNLQTKLAQAYTKYSKQVKGQMTGLAKSVTDACQRMKPQITSVINKIKSWGKAHLSVTKQIKSANKGIVASFKGLLSSVLPFMTIIGAFNLLKQSTTDAMGAIEDTNMFMAVFGQNAQTMDKRIKQLNQDMGLGVNQTKSFTAIIGQMGSAMGLTSEQTMDMATSMAKMAGDISSFYNADIVQVQEDLRSALSGSNEVLTKYGIVLRENTIQQYAYKHGIAAVGTELTSAQRAMALTAMVEQQLGMANGDLARTMDTPAGRARRLSTAFSDLKVALGNVVLPIWNAVMPGLIALANALTTIFNKIAAVVNGILSLFGMGLKLGGSGGMASDAEAIGSSLAEGLDDASGSAGGVADDLASGAKSAKEMAKGLMGIDELNVLSSPEKDSGGGSGGSGGSGGGAGSGLGSAIEDTYKVVEEGESVFDEIGEKAQAFIDAIKEVWSKIAIGFLPYKQNIIDQWNLLKLNVQTLGQEMVNFFTSCWENGGSNIAIHLGSLGATITETFLGISNVVVEALTDLFKHLNPENNENVQGFINSFDDMILAIKRFVGKFDEWLQVLKDNGGQEFLNNCADIAFILGTTLMDAFTDLIDTITDFLSEDDNKRVKDFGKVLEDISETLKDLSKWVQDNIGWLSVLAGVITGLVAGMKLAPAVIGAITLAFQGWGWIVGIVEGVGAVFSWLWSVVLVPVGQAIMAGLGAIASFFGISVGAVVAIIAGLVAAGVLLWKNWDTIKEKCKELWTKVCDWWDKTWDGICEACQNISKTCKEKWEEIQTTIIEKCEEIWDGIVGWFEDIVGWFTGGWKDSEKETDKGWDNIEESIDSGAGNAIKGLELKMSSVAPNISKVWDNVKSGVSTGWSNIKTTLTDWGTKAKDGVTGALGQVTSGASSIWSNVYNGVSTGWSNIKTNVSTWAGKAKDGATSALNGVTGGVSTIWGNIKNGVSGAWNNVKGAVSTAASSVKDQVGSSLSGAKDKASTVWTNIKNGVGGGWNTVKSTVATYATNVKNQVGTSLDGAKSKVTNIWTGIKNGVSSAWNGIKTAVQTAVNNVKKCLNFSWSLPKPKIPKFSVSGGQAPWGFGGKGKLPSISIKWNAKGGIFDSPTIFNTSRGLQGVGEAGAEAIIPISNLWKELGQQFDKQNQVLSNKGNNQPIVVNVQLDGKTIATTTVDNFKQMARLGNLDTSWL